MCGIVAPFNGELVSVQYVNPSVDRSDSTTQGWWGTTRGSQKTIKSCSKERPCAWWILKQVLSLRTALTLKITQTTHSLFNPTRQKHHNDYQWWKYLNLFWCVAYCWHHANDNFSKIFKYLKDFRLSQMLQSSLLAQQRISEQCWVSLSTQY